jgi:2-polyprenyl-3-methyl-5-hydroxy-6-metoxy-1,4-benzoquinol methylase
VPQSQFTPNLAHRQLVPEVMDDPALDPAAHQQALAGLTRVNSISFAASRIFRAIRAISPATDLHITDIASGAGDIPIALYKLSRAHGLQWRILGCDISPTALHHAKNSAIAQDTQVTFHQLNALQNPLPPADIYISSLFFHHLTEPDALSLLTSMASARKGIVISDLTRSHLAHLATQLGVHLLSRSPVVHIDGPRSVRAAFTPQEFNTLAQQAGLKGHKIRRIWPFRMLLTWSRP